MKDVPHAVVPSSGTRAKHNRELGYISTCDSRHKLCAVLRDSALLRIGADHKARNVLKEDKGDATLGT